MILHMTSEIKRLITRILLVLFLLIATIGALAYDSFYSAPTRYTVRYETLNSIYIPEQMNDVSLLFFSDIDYGTFMDKERLAKLVNTINGLSPDIVVFGGDLFDQDAPEVTNETGWIVIQELSRIEAPLGKFAVLGDVDCKDPDHQAKVNYVLYNSDFEILHNNSILVRNEGSQSITLVGLENQINGNQDINSAYANVSRTSFSFAICHTPDTASLVPLDTTKYFLAGHSHGGQAFIGYGLFYTPVGAIEYTRGKHVIQDSFTLDITNGVGTTKKDVRFLTNAEVVLYRLQHTSITDLNQ